MKLIGLMLILTVVQSVIMLIPDWNGMQGSAEADEIDLLLDVMIVLSSLRLRDRDRDARLLHLQAYRAKPGDESDGKPIHGNTRLEIAWTVIPTVIVLFAAAYSWVILDDIEAEASDQMEVNVTAQQYKWTFEYPETGVTSNEFHVPSGTQLELHLAALEVLHSFWVPEWRIKRDLVPIAEGNPTDVDNIVRVTPDVEGEYSAHLHRALRLGPFDHAGEGRRRVARGVSRRGWTSRRQSMAGDLSRRGRRRRALPELKMRAR